MEVRAEAFGRCDSEADAVVDRQVRVSRRLNRFTRPTGRCTPFRNLTDLGFVALWGVIGAQLMVLAVNWDDGTVPGFMTTVGRLTVSEKRHKWQLRGSKTVHVPSFKNRFAALPTTDRYAKTSVQQDLG